ncbi:hypothetical protein KFK09_016954 [Dendrobium nobile]|uniref:Uncharacterized protein n=1 Tax=Dendrobium nobile TaxID=94219 RepID=A0A8T3B056_DENNO|nr:hypothetical protein KFK09_016954 [Dendrobium nobile]
MITEGGTGNLSSEIELVPNISAKVAASRLKFSKRNSTRDGYAGKEKREGSPIGLRSGRRPDGILRKAAGSTEQETASFGSAGEGVRWRLRRLGGNRRRFWQYLAIVTLEMYRLKWIDLTGIEKLVFPNIKPSKEPFSASFEAGGSCEIPSSEKVDSAWIWKNHKYKALYKVQKEREGGHCVANTWHTLCYNLNQISAHLPYKYQKGNYSENADGIRLPAANKLVNKDSPNCSDIGKHGKKINKARRQDMKCLRNEVHEITEKTLLVCLTVSFIKDQSKCTVTGFNTIENSHKPLPHTAIFPFPYDFRDEDDNGLGQEELFDFIWRALPVLKMSKSTLKNIIWPKGYNI